MPNMNAHSFSKRVSLWLATGLGVGLVAPAPGTVGSLWGLPLAWAVGQLDPYAQRLAALLLVPVAMVICNVAARMLGGGKDPQAIVFDEIAVLPIVFLGTGEKSAAVWVVGFLLFRLFDITKPWPVNRLEQLPGGVGIVADDFAAALYACLALHAMLWADTSLQLHWLFPS